MLAASGIAAPHAHIIAANTSTTNTRNTSITVGLPATELRRSDAGTPTHAHHTAPTINYANYLRARHKVGGQWGLPARDAHTSLGRAQLHGGVCNLAAVG